MWNSWITQMILFVWHCRRLEMRCEQEQKLLGNQLEGILSFCHLLFIEQCIEWCFVWSLQMLRGHWKPNGTLISERMRQCSAMWTNWRTRARRIYVKRIWSGPRCNNISNCWRASMTMQWRRVPKLKPNTWMRSMRCRGSFKAWKRTVAKRWRKRTS